MSAYLSVVRIGSGFALISAGVGLTGCNNSKWNTALLPQDVTITTLEPASTNPINGTPMAQAIMPPPTTTGLDRSAWEPVVLYTPPPTTDHGPLYYRTVTLKTPITRDNGEYPTVDTCLQTETRADDWKRAEETIAQPFVSVIDVALMPIRAIRTAPWRTVHTRVEPYDRLPTELTSRTTDAPTVVPDTAAQAELERLKGATPESPQNASPAVTPSVPPAPKPAEPLPMTSVPSPSQPSASPEPASPAPAPRPVTP